MIFYSLDTILYMQKETYSLIDNIIIFLLATTGGIIFYEIHIPLPWMLGPLVTTLLWKMLRKKAVSWSKPIRNSGLVILGYTMGSPFTLQIGRQIFGQLPGMILSTLAIMTISLLVGWFTSRRTGVGLINGILGSVPGGLSQMVIVCEEIEGADVAIVTLMQITRLLTVVFTVPLLATYGLANDTSGVTNAVTPLFLDPWTLTLFAIVSIISAQLARMINFPTPYLMGPALGTIALIIEGNTAPHLPQVIIALAQISIAIQMGADIEFNGLKNWKAIVLYSFGGILTVIISSLGIDYILSKVYPISFLTAFISTSPGGMVEMGITAMTVHADVSLVVAYQLFRLLSILILAIPTVKWCLIRHSGNKSLQPE
ncbi:MAG: rane protein AbrB duplication [Firmicutes bacterium]|nr:rane protein AbrB duplication [Bacillota bacterium]